MFTTLPNNFDSLHNECIFAYADTSDGDSVSDKVVDILNSDTDVTLLVKKFYSTCDFQVNVAPIVRSLTYPNIVAAECGFVPSSQIEQGVMRVHVADDDNESSSVILTQSRHGEPLRGVVTSMPKSPDRVISRGEREYIKIYLDAAEQVTITQRQYARGVAEAVAEEDYTATADSFGFVTFSLLVDPLSAQSDTLLVPEIERLEIEIVGADDVVVERLRYIVIDAPYEPIRLAWVSSYASIEHYTFPNVVTRSVTSDGVEHLTLASAPESDAMREAIGEVVRSPRVWVECEGEYRRCRLCSERIDLTPRAELTTVQLEIEY